MTRGCDRPFDAKSMAARRTSTESAGVDRERVPAVMMGEPPEEDEANRFR